MLPLVFPLPFVPPRNLTPVVRASVADLAGADSPDGARILSRGSFSRCAMMSLAMETYTRGLAGGAFETVDCDKLL